MITRDGETGPVRALRGLEDGSAQVRLRAALEVGTAADPRCVDVLVERCAVEPEFFVRDMLTWALARYPAAVTVPKLVAALGSDRAQARSQALHTLSKIGDPGAWPAITRELLTDADDAVARSAWRAAVVLVPEEGRKGLAEVLATQLGRGGLETRLSLSRAFVALGEAAAPVLRAAATGAPETGAAATGAAATAAAATGAAAGAREHALATERLVRDPDTGFEYALWEAKRIMVGG
ncbi:HEAT repeat domain-containing protein [Streptomyces polychromogenes]|uniref:HEAT repeat domain-containing protein n=1 Tax=Streptomyces polychromogenes TaxID=67342 RepID=A0ABN0VCZ5_9ACTN